MSSFTLVDGAGWSGLYVNDTLVAEGAPLAGTTILRHAQAHGPVTSMDSVAADADWLRGRGGLPVSLAEVRRPLH